MLSKRFRPYVFIASIFAVVPILISCGGGGGGGSAALTGRGAVQGFAYLEGQNTLRLSRSATRPAGTQPATGAAVSIDGTAISGTTDSSGHFLLQGITAGTVSLRVQPTGQQPATRPVTIIGDSTVWVGDPPITRQAAFDLVKQAAQDTPLEKLLILGTQNPIPANVTVYPGMANPLGAVNQNLVSRFNSEQWFFLVDPHAAYMFQHPVRYYFVDAQTGVLTRKDAESWPLINGTPFYKVSDETLASPDKLNEPTNIENEDPPRHAEVTASSVPRHHVPGCESGTTYTLIVRGSTDGYMRNSVMATEAMLRSTYNVPAENMYTVEPFHSERPAVNIDTKLKAIMARAQPCDTILIFVFGHGYDGGGMDGDYAWQPTGLSPFKNEQSELVLPETFDFTGLKACHLHMYIECCWSGDWIPTLSAKLLPKTGLDASIITATDGEHRGLALSNLTFLVGVTPVLVYNSYFVEAAGQLGPGAYDPISLFDRTLSNLEDARHTSPYARLAKRAGPQMWVRPRQPGEICVEGGAQTSFNAPTHSPLVTGSQYAFREVNSTGTHNFATSVGTARDFPGVSVPVFPVDTSKNGTLIKRTNTTSDTANGVLTYQVDYYNSSGTAVASTQKFNPPDRIPNGLTVGQTFTQNVTQTVQQTGGGTQTYTLEHKTTLQGFESVTIPAGTFPNSAKLRFEYRLGTSVVEILTCWYAPNVGLVKVDSQSGYVNELTSYSIPQ